MSFKLWGRAEGVIRGVPILDAPYLIGVAQLGEKNWVEKLIGLSSSDEHVGSLIAPNRIAFE